MLFEELVSEICAKAEAIDDTEGAWEKVKATLELCTFVIETSAEAWDNYLCDMFEIYHNLATAADFKTFVTTSEHIEDFVECIEFSMTTPDSLGLVKEYLDTVAIAIPEEGTDIDLQTSLDLTLADIYNQSLATYEERKAKEDAEAALNDDGIEGEKDNDDYVSPIVEEDPTE